jgi:hypothetical protein
MPTAHLLQRRPGGDRRGRSLVRFLTGTTLLGLLIACGPSGGNVTDDVARASGRLRVGDRAIELVVTACATINGRFAETLPVEGAETTLTATGRDIDQAPVTVVVRRTRSASAPHVVQSVEIGIGDARRTVEALVLYRAFDERTGRWTSIDPDAASTRRDADGPLLALDDGRVRARGTTRRAPSGAPVVIRLDADCPIDLGDGPGLA